VDIGRVIKKHNENMASDFQEFFKARLSNRELKTIRGKIENLEDKGFRPKKIVNVVEGQSKKLNEKWKAERVYRTETKKIETEKILEASDKFKIKHFRVFVDKNACDNCKKLAGKVFTAKDIEKAGTVPHHPNCRCQVKLYNPKS
jgi:SPP1 gp7 family putative phage head morphogenesis protein